MNEIIKKQIELGYASLLFNTKDDNCFAFDKNGCWVTYLQTDDINLKRILYSLKLAADSIKNIPKEDESFHFYNEV